MELGRQALSLSDHNFIELKQAAALGDFKHATKLNYEYTRKTIEALRYDFEVTGKEESTWTKLINYKSVPVSRCQMDCFKSELVISDSPISEVLNFTSLTCFQDWLTKFAKAPIEQILDDEYEDCSKASDDADIILKGVGRFLFPYPTEQLDYAIRHSLHKFGMRRNELSITAGPPKTTGRCQTKGQDYFDE